MGVLRLPEQCGCKIQGEKSSRTGQNPCTILVPFGCPTAVYQTFLTPPKMKRQIILTKESNPNHLKFGVPQGSVPGPVLYTMYMFPLGTIIRNTGASHHFYEDETQLYSHINILDLKNLACYMSNSIQNTAAWMTSNKLKLNDAKTEV